MPVSLASVFTDGNKKVDNLHFVIFPGQTAAATDKNIFCFRGNPAACESIIFKFHTITCCWLQIPLLGLFAQTTDKMLGGSFSTWYEVNIRIIQRGQYLPWLCLSSIQTLNM